MLHTHQKKFFLLVSVSYFIFLLFPKISCADTYVYGNDLSQGGTWTKEGSPYILQEPAYVPEGVSLQILAGVTIMSASTSEDMEPHSISLNGSISVFGTVSEPVTFINLKSLYFSHNISSLSNVVLQGTGIDIWQGTSTLNSVTITNAVKGISLQGSVVDITKSTFDHNAIAIYSDKYISGPVMASVVGMEGLGDITNLQQNILSVHESSFVNTGQFAIKNMTENEIHAENNWWGSSLGPLESSPEDGREVVSGLVRYTPWKESLSDIPPCCSNVLFIPGIQASRLYHDSRTFLGTSTNTLWEPNRNNDAKKLFLDDQGDSILSSVYTKDIIDSAFGVKNIYKSFVVMMNGLVSEKKIQTWVALPYDWRKDVSSVVDQSVVNQVLLLASSSKTRKVTVIAHSNGGLVAKVLMKKLETMGMSEYIDRVIFVAVPELGTPQSIPSMLHGDDQALLGGFVLSKNSARTFSRNMKGAYGLLPSKKFFEGNTVPVLRATGIKDVMTYEDMKKFLTKNSWSTSSTDTSVPLLLKDVFVDGAQYIHDSLDAWKHDDRTLVISGWGLPTTNGVSYERGVHCLPTDVNCNVEHTITTTYSGDGTVLTKSSDREGTHVFMNLKSLAHDLKEKVKHADIFEVEPLLAFVKTLVAGVANTQYQKYFSPEEPVSTEEWAALTVHSPVDIDVYDADGNHLGKAPNPVVGSDLDYIEDNVYDVDYISDGENIKKIFYDMKNGPFLIRLTGNGVGVFAATVEIGKGDIVIASTTFADMPVTPLMSADVVIATSSESLISGTFMNIDVDGDGVTDIVSKTAQALKARNNRMTTLTDIYSYVEYIRKTISILGIPQLQKDIWFMRLDRILNSRLGKYIRIEKKGVVLRRFREKTLIQGQAMTILKEFERLLGRLERKEQ